MKFVFVILFVALVIAHAADAYPTLKSAPIIAKEVAKGPACKVGKVFKPASCVCAFKTLCTPKLCLCYQTIDACLKTFARRSVCLCKKGTSRSCKGKKCKCTKSAKKNTKKVGKKGKSSKKAPEVKLASCAFNKAYEQSSCLCSASERCSAKFTKLIKSAVKPKAGVPVAKSIAKVGCMCFDKVQTCPKTSTFPSAVYCKCKGKQLRRKCSKGVCSCAKVPACNPFAKYSSRNKCYCSLISSFMMCKIDKKTGYTSCGCKHVTKKCPSNKSVTPGKCWCNTKNNTWRCDSKAGKRKCICSPKPFCEIGERVKRNSCSCSRRPVTDLMDENAEKKRVFRAYGWTQCRLSNPKDKKSRRT
jgi:hypothetical protein